MISAHAIIRKTHMNVKNIECMHTRDEQEAAIFKMSHGTCAPTKIENYAFNNHKCIQINKDIVITIPQKKTGREFTQVGKFLSHIADV